MTTRAPHVDSLRPWEEERSFQEHLYEWMDSAPWLGLSAGVHLLAFFILSAFPWDSLQKLEPPTFVGRLEEPVQPPPDVPPEVLEPVEKTDEPIEDPTLIDADLDPTEDDSEDPWSLMDAPPSESSADLNDSLREATNDIMGLGGGGGPKQVGRGFGRRNVGRIAGRGIEDLLESALEWLSAHQGADGSWDCDGFSAECGKIGNSVCDGPGRSGHDVGVTSLALLAFLGEGNTSEAGKYKEQVAKGIKWLRDMQDPDTGLIGDKSSHEFLYNHSIATLALCEAYYASKSPRLKRVCQEAIYYINRSRNPYGAWRYDEPPSGTSDTSVTGWMVFAIKAAEDAGLAIDEGAYDGALSWLEEVTDPSTGRVGYNEFGSRSSRITGVNDHFPSERGEAMTAVGLLSRVFMGQTDLREHPILEKHGDLMLRTLPAWDPDGLGNDMYYWYYGTYAMYQLGGRHWKKWEAALKPTLIETQRTDGDARGSWDPNGPWGFSGGRVYSTALMALSAQVYFRYNRVTGSR